MAKKQAEMDKEERLLAKRNELTKSLRKEDPYLVNILLLLSDRLEKVDDDDQTDTSFIISEIEKVYSIIDDNKQRAWVRKLELAKLAMGTACLLGGGYAYIIGMPSLGWALMGFGAASWGIKWRDSE